MGRYVAIGLMTGLHFDKVQAAKLFDSAEEPIQQLRELYAPECAYDLIEAGDTVGFALKPEILTVGLTEFLCDFYQSRYAFNLKANQVYIDEVIEKVQSCRTAEQVLKLATEEQLYRFQMDQYWDPIFLYGKWSDTLQVACTGIDLSIDGKILMEYDNYLWEFVTALMREKFSQHKAALALHMTITG